MASTHKETKQFYTLYNTLDDTKLYLEKEVIHELLNCSDEFLESTHFLIESIFPPIKTFVYKEMYELSWKPIFLNFANKP